MYIKLYFSVKIDAAEDVMVRLFAPADGCAGRSSW
jgi:hypothetical protein